MPRYSKIVLITMLTVFLFTASTSVTAEEAKNQIGNASLNIQEAENDGVPVQRLKDLLLEANQTYRARKSLDNASFNRVTELTERIEILRQEAVRANDEVDVLEEQIQDAKSRGINTSEAQQLLHQANESLQAGRYEESLNRVDRAYSALSEAEALSVQLQTFYQQETDSFLSFVRNNVRKIALASTGALIIGFLSFRELKVFLLRRRKEKLEKKAESVQELIMDLEKDYYEEQDVPKRAFEIRKQKFREILNDADSRIPELEDRIQESRTIQSFLND